MQAPSLQPTSRSGFRGGVPHPGSGGPPVPLGPSTAAGLGALQGPVQPGLNPAHAVGHSSYHAVAGTGLGVASQGMLHASAYQHAVSAQAVKRRCVAHAPFDGLLAAAGGRGGFRPDGPPAESLSFPDGNWWLFGLRLHYQPVGPSTVCPLALSLCAPSSCNTPHWTVPV